MWRTESLYFIISISVFFVGARPLKSPDFVSQWFRLESTPGRERIDVYHYLKEVPALVQVQVRSDTTSNYRYIFPAVGLVPRDDDSSDPYAAVVYLYNEKLIAISGLSENNHYRGRTIYTENSNYWEGPNSDDSYSCYVRVRAWKLSSFPRPDYHLESLEIKSACQNGPGCFYELTHGFKEYPSMAIVRTKLNGSTRFGRFMSDAVGSGLMVYENSEDIDNGYVTFGFNSEDFRIWTDSSMSGYIFIGSDGTAFKESFKTGELEILAWRASTLTPTSEETIQLGWLPGGEFDQDKHINILSETENIFVNLWAEATTGSNSGFRFIGSGSLAYSTMHTTSPCSYGGLTYAFTNTSIRIWKPGPAGIGNVICIPKIFGGGMYTQGSNEAQAKAHIWVPQESTLHWNCSTNDDCFDSNSACIDTLCKCVDGFHEADRICEKVLTCDDPVPSVPSLERRARNYVIDPNSSTDKYIDDSTLILSWYQATTSKGTYQMPSFTYIRLENSCGSKLQVYVNGSHPEADSIDETPVELQACYDNCTQTARVLVRRCGDGSLQYQLKALSVKNIAYCFDPPEMIGIQEFDPAPDVEDFNLNLTVELHFNTTSNTDDGLLITSYNPYLTFNCTNDKALPRDLFYTTYWFVGSKLFLALGPWNAIENLTEKMLNDKKQGLGAYISCGVRISKTTTGLMTDLRRSAEQFYGIKVHDPVVVLKKGENAYVRFEPTAPIGCRYSNKSQIEGNCPHPLYMVHPDTEGCDIKDIINVQKVRTCGSSLKANRVNEPWTRGDIYQYEITTKDQNYADGHQFRLTLEMDEHYHKIWRGYRIDDIMVYVTHNDGHKFKQCYSHVDPHMQTADGYSYENQHGGEFILYRNVKYGIEVQEKTTICNGGRAYCACAVAVRAGGDVFLINVCGGLKFIGFTSCSDGGILDVRNRTNLRYQVFTPIGTYINVQIRPHPSYYNLLNIDVFMAPKDINHTEGLCGYFDDDSGNDLQKRNRDIIPTQNNRRNYHPEFSEEWRLKSFEQNYLRLDPGSVRNWQAEHRDMFCFCNKSLYNNTDAEAMAVCSPSIYSSCTESKRYITENLCQGHFQRNRRSLSILTRNKELKRRQKLVNKETQSIKKRETSSHSIITEDVANEHCSGVINSEKAVTDFGHRLKSIDPQQLIKECAFDVSEGNDLSWAEVYPSVLNQVIEANNERDPEYTEAHKEEAASFKSQSCPFRCNGNGNCSDEGECQCIPGFYGPDCSINETELLEIEDIEGGGLCDIGFGEECQCFHIQTTNLLEQFKCSISETLIMANGSKAPHNVSDRTGEYIDIFSGVCCVPYTRDKRSETGDDVFVLQYEFAVSNNGKDYGNAAKVYLYDSSCQQQVNKEDIIYFALKENTCFASGGCRILNETHTSDRCKVCNPENDMFNWTNICETSGTRSMLGYVLGTCLGLLIVLVVILVFCLWRHVHGKKMMSVSAELAIYRAEPPRLTISPYRRPDLNMFNNKKSK